MNNKYDEKFDICLDWILSQIRNSYIHKTESELIDMAIFKFADRTNYKKQLENDLLFALSCNF